MSFTARYKGVCAECDSPIRPGDEIEYDSDDLVIHVDCQDQEITRRLEYKKQDVCTICWLIRPCEHDEETGRQYATGNKE